MVLYNRDYTLRGDAAKLHEQQFYDNQWREQLSRDAGALYNRRQGENAQLPQQYVNAATGASAFQMQDDLRNQAFNAARRGTRGGSADIDRQTQARAAHGGRLAQAQAVGQDAQRMQNAVDREQLLRWMQQAYAPGRGGGMQTQGMLDASAARAGLTGQMGRLDMMADQQQVGHQGLMSQITGGQLSNAAGMFRQAGQTGTGPEWAQRLGSAMTRPQGSYP